MERTQDVSHEDYWPAFSVVIHGFSMISRSNALNPQIRKRKQGKETLCAKENLCQKMLLNIVKVWLQQEFGYSYDFQK